MSKFFLTTSIAYTNAPAHIGFALELLEADVLARYNRAKGRDVFFLTGTDEHGQSVARAADKAGKGPEKFVDEISEKYRNLGKKLGISNSDFIRTTDGIRHLPAVIKIWNKLLENDDLYKKKYRGLYCIGHEAFVKKSELENGLCPLHQTKPEMIEEENWFFKLSKYKKRVGEAIESDDYQILPETRKREVLNLIKDTEDVSFSRPAKALSWGIKVPNDPEQIMYVWPDALTNYISAIGYSDESQQFQKLWPADVHLIGKDILRFHAIIWPAMLLAVSLPLPKRLLVHGFITVDGQKMSKTIGNVVDPFKLLEKYPLDAIRYFLLREIPSNEDGDFSEKKLEERYNGDLANNLGNLVSRVATLIQTRLEGELIFEERFFDEEIKKRIAEIKEEYAKSIESFKLHEALAKVFELLTFANGYLEDKKPWADVSEHPDHFLKTLTSSLVLILNASALLEPFIPDTAGKINAIFGRGAADKISEGKKFTIKKGGPLFPRI